MTEPLPFAKGVGLKVLELRPIGGAHQIMADILAKNVARAP